MNHWALIHRAVREAEERHGRYLTLPELEKIHEGASSSDLTPVELTAVQRFWPGMQLEFKLEAHSG